MFPSTRSVHHKYYNIPGTQTVILAIITWALTPDNSGINHTRAYSLHNNKAAASKQVNIVPTTITTAIITSETPPLLPRHYHSSPTTTAVIPNNSDPAACTATALVFAQTPAGAAGTYPMAENLNTQATLIFLRPQSRSGVLKVLLYTHEYFGHFFLEYAEIWRCFECKFRINCIGLYAFFYMAGSAL